MPFWLPGTEYAAICRLTRKRSLECSGIRRKVMVWFRTDQDRSTILIQDAIKVLYPLHTKEVTLCLRSSSSSTITTIRCDHQSFQYNLPPFQTAPGHCLPVFFIPIIFKSFSTSCLHHLRGLPLFLVPSTETAAICFATLLTDTLC